jgi:hypothetical protein
MALKGFSKPLLSNAQPRTRDDSSPLADPKSRTVSFFYIGGWLND